MHFSEKLSLINILFFLAGFTRVRRKDSGVISLPSHFKVDDPEPLGKDISNYLGCMLG